MRSSALRAVALLPVLLGLAVSSSAPGAGSGPVLHVPIPENLQDDWSLGATVAGDLPAALETKNGLVKSPDARKPPAADDPSYGKNAKIANIADDGTYAPDRDTARPEVMGYDEPFRPATAPFKRLSAFDTVDAGYKLHVRSEGHEALAKSGTPAVDGSEEQFFADIVADLQGTGHVRIPSVGPGAHVIRAHVAAGERDVPFSLWQDGADNWFVSTPDEKDHGRVRLVMEISIPRAAFGGEFGNPGWGDFKAVPKLPPNAALAAKRVAAHIGVSNTMTPREAVRRLVAYHRSFVDSNDPPSGQNDIYLDLALSQKGVCRHRAFSFLVTALGLGLPTRMVINEAHAWVELHDGKLWRRIDLGGAGRTANEPVREGLPYEPPADPFQWPTGATPGETLLGGPDSNGSGQNGGGKGGRGPGTNGRDRDPKGANSSSTGPTGQNHSGGDDSNDPANSSSFSGSGDYGHPGNEKDERPRSAVTLAVGEPDTRRGSGLKVSGTVVAEREACSNVVVDITLREVGKAASHAAELRVGSLATDARGSYQGSLVVPSNIPLGDYEVIAKTSGNMRCGRSN
jgi:hypothetical protein